jgi:hypothetical protein
VQLRVEGGRTLSGAFVVAKGRKADLNGSPPEGPESARQLPFYCASAKNALTIRINYFLVPLGHASHSHAFGDPLALREIRGIVAIGLSAVRLMVKTEWRVKPTLTSPRTS